MREQNYFEIFAQQDVEMNSREVYGKKPQGKNGIVKINRVVTTIAIFDLSTSGLFALQYFCKSQWNVGA